MPILFRAGSPLFRLRRSGWIRITTATGLALGLASFAAWRITGNTVWLSLFFQWLWPLLMVGLTAVEARLSLAVRHAFLPDEPLYLAWSLIGSSAVCDFVGSLCTQWLSSASPLNPLVRAAWWSASAAQELRQFGSIVGGTLRFALLSAGLLVVLRIYRKAGFLGRLKTIDWFLAAGVLLYVANETRELIVAIQHGKSPNLLEILGWPVDPLLCVLLFETRVLARSIQRMGTGYIGHCWIAFTLGILLVWLGDLGIWATAFGHLSWEWTSLGWYVWLPATGAFAIAPAYQLEAIEQAMHERTGNAAA